MDNIWLDASYRFLRETRTSWRNSTGSVLTFSPRAALLLEVLMVLMCVGAVTGKQINVNYVVNTILGPVGTKVVYMMKTNIIRPMEPFLLLRACSFM